MGIIEDFIERYRREYDFYDQVARLVARQLEDGLRAAGIRAMVTFRAKEVARLEGKVRDRATRTAYTSVEDIYADIADLAGARVGLYFPAQREQVGLLINELFVVNRTKNFPDPAVAPKYTKRFLGYCATHYHVQLRESTLIESLRRYAAARAEIQVASVLMHAWAEVEHDLGYKQFQGQLSQDEYAILDELNGMVMVGEIALERLQRAGDLRVAVPGRTFANHYDLAAYLLSAVRALAGPAATPPQAGLGRVDLLYDLLARLSLVTPDAVKRYVDDIRSELGRRPVAEQILDRILSEDPERHRLFQELRAARLATAVSGDVAESRAPTRR